MQAVQSALPLQSVLNSQLPSSTPSTHNQRQNFNIIVAVDGRGGISQRGQIPWRKTDRGVRDMDWFKKATTDYTPANTNAPHLHKRRDRGFYFGDNFIKRAVIMGRKTWESLPARPLSNRYNIILSRNIAGKPPRELIGNGWEFVSSLGEALTICNNLKLEPWVIGGAEIYNIAISHPRVGRIYVTDIGRDVSAYDSTEHALGPGASVMGDFYHMGGVVWKCDTFFPLGKLKSFDDITATISTGESSSYDDLPSIVRVYSPGVGREKAYLDLLRELTDAPLRPNRTGVPTHGVFMRSLRFNLYDPSRGAIMPLLTTKKMSYKLIISELLWFLGGKCTNTSYLHEHNNHIWDGNTTREFLDSRGLTTWKPGQTGAIYGFQWRHWNGEFRRVSDDHDDAGEIPTYNQCKRWPVFDEEKPPSDSHTTPGIDQIAKVIQTLKTDPWDRRMIVSAWNPEQINSMALPPCHWSFQFHVDTIDVTDGTQSNKNDENRTPTLKLNCSMNMRSADVALGVPFNIASYATLVHIIARIVNMQPGELVINMTDCHIYQNHLDGIKAQLSRTPRRFPTFKFGPEITAIPPPELTVDHFTAATLDQFVVEDYDPHPPIKFEMAV